MYLPFFLFDGIRTQLLLQFSAYSIAVESMQNSIDVSNFLTGIYSLRVWHQGKLIHAEKINIIK
jgi:hypothetical protein